MGICTSNNVPLTPFEQNQLKQETQKDRALDREINKSRNIDSELHKLLLLGAGESGTKRVTNNTNTSISPFRLTLIISGLFFVLLQVNRLYLNK